MGIEEESTPPKTDSWIPKMMLLEKVTAFEYGHFGVELLNFRGCTKILLLGLLRNTFHFNKRAMEDVHCQSSKAPLSIAMLVYQRV